MRVIALLATYNERRFIDTCLTHLRAQGIDTYLIDNESTDDTVELASRHLGDGLLGIETLPRDGSSDLRARLRRKEELARELDADWFIHLDADELRLPPRHDTTLAQALEEADRAGYNAVNFMEFTFLPTRESPDHDHPDFQRTMRSYYPFLPELPHRLNAWKANPDVDLTWKAGHRVRFPGLRAFPESFPMRHYLFLSTAHAVEKYVGRRYDSEAVGDGWHGWRAGLAPEQIRLPSESELRRAGSDDDLDPSNPTKHHYLSNRWTAS